MRDINQLHPRARHLALKLVKECEEKGLKIAITECVRTVQEQDALYAKGRTAPGNIVTNAKGKTYSSMHQWGVAFDICRNDDKGSYYDADGFFTKVGKIGQSIGLEWGGSWTSICDKPHFQLPDWGSGTSKLKRLYNTPDAFEKTEYAITIYKGDVKIRAAKVITSVVKGKIPRGTRIEVFKRYKNWSKIKYDGTIGFVRNKFIK